MMNYYAMTGGDRTGRLRVHNVQASIDIREKHHASVSDDGQGGEIVLVLSNDLACQSRLGHAADCTLYRIPHH